MSISTEMQAENIRKFTWKINYFEYFKLIC